MRTRDAPQSEQSTTDKIQRILFIGFDKIPGHRCINWEDWNWPNAADFEMVFINCDTLTTLLDCWEQERSKDVEGFPEEPFERLHRNIYALTDQALEIINSGRSIIALAAPPRSFGLGAGLYGYLRSVDTYSWCPLPIEIHTGEGDIIKDVDPRLTEYRRQISEWQLYFDAKPKPVEHIDRDDLLPGQFYVMVVQGLFENLSLQPLGVAVRCCVVDRTRGPRKGDATSGPIYLLHYPVGGNLRESVRCLLREFCKTDLIESEQPEWIQLILPPRGAEIDKQIHSLTSEIEQLSEQRARLITEREQVEYWWKLLYETGDVLEDAVREALKLLGVDSVEPGPKGDHDIVGEFGGEILIFEVKGLTKSAGRKEVFDLDRHINEFKLKNPGKHVSKGVLVANAYRHDPPETRDKGEKRVFAGDAVDHAKPLEFALLDTRVLYKLVTDVVEGRVTNTSEALESLRNTTGIYSYKAQ